MTNMVAVIKKMLSFFLPRNEVTATYITVCWEAEEHKIKVKKCQHIDYLVKNKKVPTSFTTQIISRFKNSTGLIIWANNLGKAGLDYFYRN